MNDEQLVTLVKTMVHEITGADPATIVNSRHLMEYGIDSVVAVDLAVRIEERLRIEIPDEALPALASVSDVVGYLRRRLEGATAPMAIASQS